jgi:hypothetical protein
MKIHMAVIVVLLSLIITTHSLAAGNPLAPNSEAPIYSASADAAPTQTPVPQDPTVTPDAAATTSATPSALTGSTTPSVEVSPTPAVQLVVIDGQVTMAAGITLPAGTGANLLVFNSSTQQVEQTIPVAIQPDGTYEFHDVQASTTSVFLVTVDYAGVTYNSDAVTFDGTTLLLNMPVTIYSTSKDMSLLNLTQAHLIFNFSVAGKVQVTALYVILNSGQSSVMIASDGSSLPFIDIPAGAQSVNFQLDQNSSPLLKASGGFAFLPGTNLQYGIIATFTLPYTGRLVFTQPFSLPVSAVNVIVPQGVIVSSKQLTDAGNQVASGSTYHLYQGASLASGSTLTFTISGHPGDQSGLVLPGGIVLPGIVLDQHAWIVIGAAAVGLILIALGIFLFFRDRMLRKLDDEDFEEDGDGPVGPDALGDNRDSILDAILNLDDQYKAGDISKEAYTDRRDELKNRLKKLP